MNFFDKEKYKEVINYINKEMSKSPHGGFTAPIEELTKIKFDISIKEIAEICNYLSMSFEYSSFWGKMYFRKNYR